MPSCLRTAPTIEIGEGTDLYSWAAAQADSCAERSFSGR